MGWANSYIERLLAGDVVQFRPRGNSMTPHIRSGDLVRVRPLLSGEPRVGDVVLCRIGRAEYLHFVRGRRLGGEAYQIANARGHINGWARRDKVFGILEKATDARE